MTNRHSQPTTHSLWCDAHSALCQGRWADARGLLEALAGKADNADTLSSLTAYTHTSGVPLTGEMYAVIDSRLAWVNRVACRNHARLVAAVEAGWASAFA